MAGRSHQLLKHDYGLFAAGGVDSPVAADEFDESDIWEYPVDAGRAAKYSSSKKPIPVSRKVSRNKPGGGGGDHRGASAVASLPVSIPDWSKILREYGKRTTKRRRTRKERTGRRAAAGRGLSSRHMSTCRRRGEGRRRRSRCTRGSGGRSRGGTSAASTTPSGRRPASN